jgi:Transposase DDE domain group 1
MALSRKEAFRVNKRIRKRIARGKRKNQYRLRDIEWEDQPRPMFSASNIKYDLADKTRGLACGGIGGMHLLARQSGLIDAIDRRLHLLKIHKPYHESDHVLNIAYNLLCGGQCLEHIELRRNDEVFADALGAQRIPDPTTAGDFCRRFEVEDVEVLMETINEVRVGIWRRQPEAFFDLAVIDGDGTMAETTGQCKEGMDINHKGQWGYQPLIISLNNTGEPLYLVNRSGNRPSHEGATRRYNQAIDLCLGAGFKRVLLRGDTDFTQSKALDDWHGRGVQFIFGIDAMPNLVEMAESLENQAWKRLKREPKYTVKTQPRERPRNVKEAIVKEREFENIRLQSEEVAEFDYAPGHCSRSYRIVVVRKNLTVERGELALFDDVRYFFYITNNRTKTAAGIVTWANGRCNQEKLIGQLKGGVGALDMPVDNLVSNWAYMVMASLAWSLKIWFALSLPEHGRWREKYKLEKDKVLRMEFRTFLHAFMQIPAQVIRAGRRIVYRVLAWTQWLDVFLRGVDVIGRQVNHPLRR